MSLNKVMLIGNVGQDPEIKYFDNNNKVARITLATTERYKDKAGNQQEATEWHNLTAWGFTADIVEKWVKKGTQLYVEGRIRTRSWQDKDGNKRYTTEINVDNLQMLGRRSDNPNNNQSTPQQYNAKEISTSTKVTEPVTEEVEDDIPEDDIPF